MRIILLEVITGVYTEYFKGDLFYILLGFIIFDVVTGLLRAGKDRKINSSINFGGLIRKAGMLVGVVFLTFLDLYFNTNGAITNAGVGLLIVYEGISILENFKHIGVNLQFVTKYFDKDKYKEE